MYDAYAHYYLTILHTAHCTIPTAGCCGYSWWSRDGRGLGPVCGQCDARGGGTAPGKAWHSHARDIVVAGVMGNDENRVCSHMHSQDCSVKCNDKFVEELAT